MERLHWERRSPTREPFSTRGEFDGTAQSASRKPTAAASVRWRASNDRNSTARSDFAVATCRTSRLRVPVTIEWPSARRAATRNTTGHFTVVFTSLPLRISLSTFLHAAAASAAANKPRKTPSLNAFRTSKACNAVKASGAPVRESHDFTRGVFASTTWQETMKLLSA